MPIIAATVKRRHDYRAEHLATLTAEARALQKGSRVEVVGLANKLEWNGKFVLLQGCGGQQLLFTKNVIQEITDLPQRAQPWRQSAYYSPSSARQTF